MPRGGRYEVRRGAWTLPAYEEIASWLHARTGLTFLSDRHHDVETGIRRVMAAQRIAGPDRFLDRLRSNADSVDGLVDALTELGRASCRGRVCRYVYISVVAVAYQEKTTPKIKVKQK